MDNTQKPTDGSTELDYAILVQLVEASIHFAVSRGRLDFLNELLAAVDKYLGSLTDDDSKQFDELRKLMLDEKLQALKKLTE